MITHVSHAQLFEHGLWGLSSRPHVREVNPLPTELSPQSFPLLFCTRSQRFIWKASVTASVRMLGVC